MKMRTRTITVTAVMIALCIAVQFFKAVSYTHLDVYKRQP